MTRALLWLVPGVVVFLLATLLIAPPEVARRALVFGAAAAVPGVLALGVAVRARGRRHVDAPEHETLPPPPDLE